MIRVWLVITLSVLAAAGQTKTPAQLNETPQESAKVVADYCHTVSRFVASNRARKLTFGRQCSESAEDSSAALSCVWKQFANESAWQRWIESEDNGNYGAAFVWLRDGKAVQANITFQTPSYDWANLANYCFRPDGLVAVMTTIFNDLNLDTSVYRVAIYSHSGERLQLSETAQKLSTKQPTRIPGELIEAEKEDSSNSGRKAPLYRSTHDLPFANLISR